MLEICSTLIFITIFYWYLNYHKLSYTISFILSRPGSFVLLCIHILRYLIYWLKKVLGHIQEVSVFNFDYMGINRNTKIDLSVDVGHDSLVPV